MKYAMTYFLGLTLPLYGMDSVQLGVITQKHYKDLEQKVKHLEKLLQDECMENRNNLLYDRTLLLEMHHSFLRLLNQHIDRCDSLEKKYSNLEQQLHQYIQSLEEEKQKIKFLEDQYQQSYERHEINLEGFKEEQTQTLSNVLTSISKLETDLRKSSEKINALEKK
jgi:hypothetical protein